MNDVVRLRRALVLAAALGLAVLLAVTLVAVEAGVWSRRTTAGLDIPTGHEVDGKAREKIAAAGGLVISSVTAGGPAAAGGLAVGDTLVAADGRDLRREPHAYWAAYYRARTGRALDLEVQRGAERIAVRLPVRPIESTPGKPQTIAMEFYGSRISGSPSKVLWAFFLPWILGQFLFLAVGAVLGWLRPQDPVAFRCSLLFLCLSTALFPFDMLETVAAWPSLAVLAGVLLHNLPLAAAVPLSLDVFGRFPIATRMGKRLGRWRRAMVAGFGALFGVACALETIRLVPFALPAGLLPLAERLSPRLVDNEMLYQVPLLVLVGTLLVAQRLEARRTRQPRLRIVEFAMVLQLLGLVLFLSRDWAPNAVPSGLRAATGFATFYIPVVLFATFPFFFAYAVVARKAFGLRFFIRRGLQYLLLSKGALLVEAGLVFASTMLFLRHERTAFLESHMATGAMAMGASVLFGAFLSRVNQRLMPVLDRRFFREECDMRRLLLGLSDDLAGVHEGELILQQSAATVSRALHPSRVVVLLPDGAGKLRSRTLATDARARVGDLAQAKAGGASQLAEALETNDAVVRELTTGSPWVLVDAQQRDATEAEQARMLALGCELLIGLRGDEKLRGILGLGEKLSEEPYSREDRELLHVVADRITLALENADLFEVAKREAQQARELEIAKSVQESLFPRELPAVPGWEFAARCRPARAVGGDYYDLFMLKPGRLVFALGDVSGKGIAAALLMSNLQAHVRSRLPAFAGDLPGYFKELNAHIHAASPEGMFVTLVLGILDTERGELRFVNAGHPPPLRLGAAGPEPLASGGMPLGLFPEATFPEGRSVLEEARTLVVYSDGVTEAADAAGELFEEERLAHLLADAGALPASRVLDDIFQAVERFSGAAEQADDISAVVVQRTRRDASPGAKGLV